MGQALQAPAQAEVGEHGSAQGPPVDLAADVDGAGEGPPHRPVGRPAPGQDPVGGLVEAQGPGAQPPEGAQGLALAGADASRQSHGQGPLPHQCFIRSE